MWRRDALPARRPGLFALVAALALAAGVPAAPPQSDASGDVTIPVSVVDAAGQLVHGLAEADFTLYDGDELQQVTTFAGGPSPVSLSMLWDVSAPLVSRDDLGRVQATVLRFALGRLDDGGELLLAESSAPGTRLVRGYTSDRAIFGLAFGALIVPPRHTDTAIYDAIAASLPLTDGGRHAVRLLLVMSGGLDRDASAIPPVVLHRVVRASDVVVHAWVNAGGPPSRECPPDHICAAEPAPGASTPTAPIDRIVAETGGRRESVTSVEDFIAAMVRLERELGAQYRLTYRPRPGDGDALRMLRVEMRNPALTARTRLHAVVRAGR